MYHEYRRKAPNIEFNKDLLEGKTISSMVQGTEQDKKYGDLPLLILHYTDGTYVKIQSVVGGLVENGNPLLVMRYMAIVEWETKDTDYVGRAIRAYIPNLGGDNLAYGLVLKNGEKTGTIIFEDEKTGDKRTVSISENFVTVMN